MTRDGITGVKLGKEVESRGEDGRLFACDIGKGKMYLECKGDT